MFRDVLYILRLLVHRPARKPYAPKTPALMRWYTIDTTTAMLSEIERVQRQLREGQKAVQQTYRRDN